MPANEVTLQANIRTNAQSELRKMADGFKAPTAGAKRLEEQVTKVGNALDRTAKKGGVGGGPSGGAGGGFFGGGMKGGIQAGAAFAGANFAFSQLQSSLPQEGVGGMASNALSTVAGFAGAGFAVGGPVGAGIGAVVGAVVTALGNFKKAVEETTAAAQAASKSLASAHQKMDAEMETIRALRDIDTQGFGATELAALQRLIEEQTRYLKGDRTVDLEDTQTLGDQAIVELARIRELAERQAKYFEKTGYTQEILKRSQAEMASSGSTSSGKRAY